MATDIIVFRDAGTELWIACLPPEEGYELTCGEGRSPTEALGELARHVVLIDGFDERAPDWWRGYDPEDEEEDMA